ncbi:hypothetical protein GCM10025734_83470 [Kitasatospora paranensis]
MTEKTVPAAAADAAGEAPVGEGAERLTDSADASGAALLGVGGLLTEITRAVLERAMEAGMAERLGCGNHGPAGRGSGHSRTRCAIERSQAWVSDVLDSARSPMPIPEDGGTAHPARRHRPRRDRLPSGSGRRSRDRADPGRRARDVREGPLCSARQFHRSRPSSTPGG